MSRTRKGAKDPSWEFWSRRPLNGCCGNWAKRKTHQKERRIAERSIRKEFITEES